MAITDIYGINPNTDLPYETPRTISDQNVFLGQTFTVPELSFFDKTKNFVQNIPTNISSGIESLTDKTKSGFSQGIDLGKSALSGIISLATGVPFLGNALTGITSQFENRPLSAPVIDEFGNVYDPEELNKLNALGGYYTDPARSARRRTKRIANMLERQKLGKKISLQNLAKLQAQERAQEAAQRAAIDRMFESGQGGSGQDFTGGRFDGAGSREAYDANPTGFSGSS